MWDKTYGGFYNLVDRQGKDKSDPKSPKEAYGNAFAIYGLSAYYNASHDTGALSLAKKAFIWLDKHGHDPVYKSFFQHLQRDGTPIRRDATMPSNSDLGYKDHVRFCERLAGETPACLLSLVLFLHYSAIYKLIRGKVIKLPKCNRRNASQKGKTAQASTAAQECDATMPHP